MPLRRLALSFAFALGLAAALPARADVMPPCEACDFKKEGEACTTLDNKSGTCEKDTTGVCALACVVPGDSGPETGGGCSAAGAAGATGALWVVAALPILLWRRRRASRRP